jgi:hypothetical protein
VDETKEKRSEAEEKEEANEGSTVAKIIAEATLSFDWKFLFEGFATRPLISNHNRYHIYYNNLSKVRSVGAEGSSTTRKLDRAGVFLHNAMSSFSCSLSRRTARHPNVSLAMTLQLQLLSHLIVHTARTAVETGEHYDAMKLGAKKMMARLHLFPTLWCCLVAALLVATTATGTDALLPNNGNTASANENRNTGGAKETAAVSSLSVSLSPPAVSASPSSSLEAPSAPKAVRNITLSVCSPGSTAAVASFAEHSLISVQWKAHNLPRTTTVSISLYQGADFKASSAQWQPFTRFQPLPRGKYEFKYTASMFGNTDFHSFSPTFESARGPGR